MQSAEFRSVVGHALCACLVVCAAWPAGGAKANDIRIFFGQPEHYTGTDTTAFVPEAHWGESAPPGTYTLGIWAEIQYDGSAEAMDVWSNIWASFYTEGPITISDVDMDNFDHDTRPFPLTAYRWLEGEHEGDDPIFLCSVGPGGTYGLGGLFPREFGFGNGYTDWWSYTIGTPGEPEARYRYWLGNVTLSYTGSTAANLYFCVGSGGVFRTGGDVGADRIYFGEDEPIGLRGDAFGEHSSLPDFVFTPEAGSLVLLALAGWALRRR